MEYLENYKFSPPYNGEINGVKLVHTTGGVTCATNRDNTNWGCLGTSDIRVNVINEGTSSPIYPTDTTTGIYDIRKWNQDGSCSCIYHEYKITGETPNSAEYSLIDANNTNTVSTTDSFSLQYSEGCCGQSIGDNSGTSCADVYFYYTSSDGM